MSSIIPEHHKKEDVCLTRPEYRAPNKPNGIKVRFSENLDIWVWILAAVLKCVPGVKIRLHFNRTSIELFI